MSLRHGRLVYSRTCWELWSGCIEDDSLDSHVITHRRGAQSCRRMFESAWSWATFSQELQFNLWRMDLLSIWQWSLHFRRKKLLSIWHAERTIICQFRLFKRQPSVQTKHYSMEYVHKKYCWVYGTNRKMSARVWNYDLGSQREAHTAHNLVISIEREMSWGGLLFFCLSVRLSVFR